MALKNKKLLFGFAGIYSANNNSGNDNKKTIDKYQQRVMLQYIQ